MPRVEEFVEHAMAWKGTAFAHRQSKKGEGTDCLGLVIGALKEMNDDVRFELPNYAMPDDKKAHLGLSPKILEPIFSPRKDTQFSRGDVLVFQIRKNAYWHLGIYLGEDGFLSAWREGGVGVRALDAFWMERIHAVYELEDMPWQH